MHLMGLNVRNSLDTAELGWFCTDLESVEIAQSFDGFVLVWNLHHGVQSKVSIGMFSGLNITIVEYRNIMRVEFLNVMNLLEISLLRILPRIAELLHAFKHQVFGHFVIIIFLIMMAGFILIKNFNTLNLLCSQYLSMQNINMSRKSFMI